MSDSAAFVGVEGESSEKEAWFLLMARRRDDRLGVGSVVVDTCGTDCEVLLPASAVLSDSKPLPVLLVKRRMGDDGVCVFARMLFVCRVIKKIRRKVTAETRQG